MLIMDIVIRQRPTVKSKAIFVFTTLETHIKETTAQLAHHEKSSVNFRTSSLAIGVNLLCTSLTIIVP